MIPEHIMNTGIKTLQNPNEINSNFDKINLITEELLYMKLLKNHKSIMFFLLIFHSLIISIITLKTCFSSSVYEKTIFCKNALLIKNFTYIFLNCVIFGICLQSVNRDKALLSNITFYEKAGFFFVLGMIMSFSILFFKFLPDFMCGNLSLNFFACCIMTSHIFVENLALLFYIKWFKNQLRNFGALIN